jgi:hypothetical protein
VTTLLSVAHEVSPGTVAWTQQTFPYQAKCLRWTNEHHLALSEADRASIDALLKGTGVESMLSID